MPVIDAIDLFGRLGDRLARFGSDDASRKVLARACAANEWFMPADVLRAVQAVRTELLDRRKLAVWLGRYAVPARAPRRVLVVMAGNIPLVGFLDLLCTLAAGHCCLVKPSGKDRVLTEYVIGQLRSIDPSVPVEVCDGQVAAEAVIATGSDNANRYFRVQYAGLPTLLRGSRQSVAVLSGRETAEQWQALADDVFAYSGLGCRNVSLLFVPRGCDVRLAAPAMNPKYVNNYRQTKALLEMEGRPFRDLGAAVLVEERAFPTALSRIHYSFYDDLSEVSAWLAQQDGVLQCVATTCLDHPRRTAFGRAQRPALGDYPDDRDVMEFLLDIK